MGTADLLAPYKRKRNFALTPEPAGKVGRKGKALSFVIQKHAARQLHYDFRLELDGTLKSWAVPKGPSLDPSQKRMAVHVEDHPLSYANFEGVIPPKQYGAGTVIVWDRGTWIPLEDPEKGLREGKLKFELRGSKLRGRWALVRMRGRDDERQESWLLMKERDEYARPASEYDVLEALPDSVNAAAAAAAITPPSPARASPARAPSAARPARAKAPPSRPKPAAKRGAAQAPQLPPEAVPAALPPMLAPQLATLVDAVPAGDEWLYEIKFDGYRIVTRIDGDDVRCFTRNGNDWSAKMPALVEAVRALGLPDGWLDGEIVVAGPKGTPSFQALQNAFDGRHTEHLQYFVFDLPFYAGHDLRNVELVERRALLEQLLARSPAEAVRFSASFGADPRHLLESARELGLEGVVGKRKNSFYRSRRSPDWIKIKCSLRQEFVIGGYTDPKGTRTGIGALLLGVHDETGKLRYAGNVGSGFDEQTLRDLKQRLEALRTDESPFAETPSSVKGHWVRPELLAEVSFSEWTHSGRVRHAVFQGLRTDKQAAGIGREQPQPVAKATRAPAAPALRITHPERVVDPTSGVTKAALVQHYADVAELMLPHLRDRPVAVVRAPGGVTGKQFFQKHVEGKHWVVDQLDPRLDPGNPPLIGISSADALLTAAQMNVIEFHTWNATIRSIERPNRMVFDLDPGAGVSWAQMQEGAQLVHSFLEQLGLVSFLKTSGGKGLHVIVPHTPRDWDTVKGFAQAIVTHLAGVIPKRFVAKSGEKNRVGRIFIDYLRNGRGATTVSAWSARARPGLGVSVPVAWDELDALSGGAQWSVANIAERLSIANTPWAAYATTRQRLDAAMKALGFKPPKAA
jgi:bifunctional non-homologous end joining protein LigD